MPHDPRIFTQFMVEIPEMPEDTVAFTILLNYLKGRGLALTVDNLKIAFAHCHSSFTLRVPLKNRFKVLTPLEIADKEAREAAEAQKVADEVARKKRESLNDLGFSTGRVNHASTQREDAEGKKESPTARALREMRDHADKTVAVLDQLVQTKEPEFVPLKVPANATPEQVAAILKTGSVDQIRFYMRTKGRSS